MNYVLVFLGGGLGSLLRFSISMIVSKFQVTMPIATLIANVISCSLFAALIHIYQQKDLIPEAYKYLIIIGICGGLSTFSTFSYEAFELLKQGNTIIALLNILFNCLICIGLFFLIFQK